ncbi:MAG: DUF4368 domain-containing protein [Oscillospiraceae bacterium]|nr:DUF4368 domain-containing protein [Oscillospiraceae bacterium]
MQNSTQKQSAELKAAKKRLAQSEKRIAELDKLFTRLYEDNVSGKISDERFEMMSKNYEAEQKELRQIVSELTAFVQASEQKNADTTQFIGIVRKYSEIPKLTPEIMHEFIEKIVVYAPDKSSGHRTQQIDICFRLQCRSCNRCRRQYGLRQKEKGCVGFPTQPFGYILNTSVWVVGFLLSLFILFVFCGIQVF